MNSRALDVVLVEDNSADVFLIREALREAGLDFNLCILRNGEEALTFIEGGATPDVFLMDWNLPRIHGKEILAAIGDCGRLENTPRIVLTSSESPADRKEVEQLGAVFIKKPRTLAEFINIGRRIKTILGVQ